MPGFPEPPPVEPLPNCAIAYLYSIGDVHYYQTVNCDNPSVTGYGITSPDKITPLGCTGSQCNSPVEPDVAAIVSNSDSSNGNVSCETGACRATDRDKPVKRPKLPFDKSKKGEKAKGKKFKRRIEGLINRPDVTTRRSELADYINVDIMDESEPLIAALNSDSTSMEYNLAVRYVEAVAEQLNSAISFSQSTNNNLKKKIFAEDREFEADTLEVIVSGSSTGREEAANVLVRTDSSSPLPPGVTSISPNEAEIHDIVNSRDARYIKWAFATDPNQANEDVLFRLFDIEIVRSSGTEWLHVGYEIDQLPDRRLEGGNVAPFVSEEPVKTNEGDPDRNISLKDRHSHLHIFQVRVTEDDPDELNENNSQDYFVFSASDVAREELIS